MLMCLVGENTVACVGTWLFLEGFSTSWWHVSMTEIVKTPERETGSQGRFMITPKNNFLLDRYLKLLYHF